MSPRVRPASVWICEVVWYAHKTVLCVQCAILRTHCTVHSMQCVCKIVHCIQNNSTVRISKPRAHASFSTGSYSAGDRFLPSKSFGPLVRLNSYASRSVFLLKRHSASYGRILVVSTWYLLCNEAENFLMRRTEVVFVLYTNFAKMKPYVILLSFERNSHPYL